MPSRDQFRRQWRTLQACIVVAAAVALGVGYVGGVLNGFVVWIIEVAGLTILMWRLRCWNCGRRLLSNAGTEIKWERVGLPGWESCRHTTCGARLL